MISLKKVSVTIQQVELRLYQYYNFKWQHNTIHNSPNKILNVKKQIQYLRLVKDLFQTLKIIV